MGLIFKLDTKKIDKMFFTLSERVPSVLHDGLDHASRSFVKRFLTDRFPSSNLKAKKGSRLAKSFQRRVSTKNGNPYFVVSSSKPSAYILEKGGVIRGNQYLTIPLESSKTKSGATKARFRVPRGKSARDLKGDFIVHKSSKGNLLLSKIKGKKKKKIEPVFVLKRRVVHRPRLGFFKTFMDHKPRIVSIMEKTLQKSIKELSERGY
ncbi:hypothetical protein AB834_00470 [PVC group bacterium (ex Bugula neritina AB1)]|nr:hypothetical protein AB834_00470 [PVC group bacterium (ex Bugula neritina AB1)]